MIRFATALGACLAVLPLAAPASPQAEALLQAAGIDQMLDLMREEGIAYGAELAEDFAGGTGGRSWDAAVARVYDIDQMRATLVETFAERFDPDLVGEVTDFYTSETGAEIVALELAARQAFLDKGLEEATKARIPDLRAEHPDAYARVTEFIEVNDLVEQNVVGALNSNYAFYVGLQEGGGFPGDLAEADILADVWAQEAEIRESTTEWLYAFLLTAYLPLEADAMDRYIEMSRSEAGQAFTRALFAGFDEMFVDLSRGLGFAASRFMVSQEL